MTTSSNTVPERLDLLRGAMLEHGLSHYLVPSADEHLNEYLPEWHRRRQWMSGFTGSAGDLLVGTAPNETWLFTDGRYHLQAEQELAGSGIMLQKVGAKEGKALGKVLGELASQHGQVCTVGYDPMVLPIAVVESLEKTLGDGGATLRGVSPNLVDALWRNPPAPPVTPLLACPIEWTGCSFGDKLDQLRQDLSERNADATVAVKLDQIAWLTNLRSTDDIPFNPVFESCLFVDGEGVHLFLHSPGERLPPDFGTDIAGFETHAYEAFIPFLNNFKGRAVLVDPDGTTQGVLDALADNPGVKIVRGLSPIEEAKAIKNDTEQKCMARAGLMASVAKTRAFLWLADEIAAGRRVTERSFLAKIEGLYAQIGGYRQLSFNTIAATGEHGAIVHYGGADDTELRNGDLFLVDSGIQMDGGTTDATRTVIVGDPTPEQRRIYTLVLKAHIAAATQLFPEGTPGAALDAVSRSPLWAERLHFDHGTGHGVGAFLNVHEGPFALTEARRRVHGTYGLKGGMITSIEPGYYRPGFGGVRLEGLYLIHETGQESDDRKWLDFKPLTWIPFDPRLTDLALLDPRERAWLQRYHEQCRTQLEPHLSSDENEQLQAAVWSRV